MPNESGRAHQKRLEREQHRPEQNEGYDQAVRGGKATPNTIENIVDLVPASLEEQRTQQLNEIDDRQAREAAAEVRRQDRSAGR